VHYSTQQVTYGIWQLLPGAFRFERNVADARHPMVPGWYRVYRREVTGSVTIQEQDIDDSYPIFAWGYGGRNSGWSKAQPNYQTSYCEVTSGTGGNDLVPGIHHDHSRTVQLRTYQYAIWRPSSPFQTIGVEMRFVQILPQNVRLNATVFAKPAQLRPHDGGNSGNDGGGISTVDRSATAPDATAMRMRAAPNPARALCRIEFQVLETANARVAVSDARGTVVHQQDVPCTAGVAASVEIETATLPAGLYSISVRCGERCETRPLVVVH
jgi:hypothetical protein